MNVATKVFRYPYPDPPPPSPHLGVGSYEHLATGVRATLVGGFLETPVPRASFHGEELALALRLGDDFRAAYTEANARAAPAEPDRPRMGDEQGRAWWRYTMARGDLRWTWPSADILIPDLLLFARRDDGTTHAVLVWPEAIRALVVPDGAELVVMKTDRPPAGSLVPRAAALALAGDRAVSCAMPVPHHLYRGGTAHREIVQAIRSAEGEPARSFRSVRPDDIVN